MISMTMIVVWAAAAKSGTKHRDNVNNLNRAAGSGFGDSREETR